MKTKTRSPRQNKSARLKKRIDAALAQLAQVELIKPQLDVEIAYSFKNALVQDTAYQSLLKNERRAFHLAAARALEVCFPDALDENAALLAEHYRRAEETEKTILFAARAGERAMYLYANPEARYFFAIALELMQTRLPTPENERAKIELALKYFTVAWARGASESDIQLLRDLAQSARNLANSAAGTNADRVRVMRVVAELGNALFARNEILEALECFREILAAAEQGHYDGSAIANASINSAGVLMVQGYFAQAEPLAQQGYEIGKTMPSQWFWFGGLAFASLARAARGMPLPALAALRDGLQQVDTAANLSAGSALSIVITTIYWIMQDWRAVLQTGEDAYARALRARDSLYQHLALAMCAQAHSELGDTQRARTLFEQSRALFQANQGQLFFADWTLAMYALTLFKLGELEAAREGIEQLIALAPVFGNLYSVGLARQLRAQIRAQVSPDETQALDDDMSAALELFIQCDARLDAARTRVAWGKILQARGKTRAAREHFEQAAAQFQASGFERELQEVRALL